MHAHSLRLAALTAALALAAPPAAARPVTLDEVLTAARAHDPQAKAQEAGVDAAKADRASGRARFLPLLHVEADLQVWDSPSEVSFLGGGAAVPQLPAPATPYEAVLAGLLQGFSTPTRIRDQVTSTLAVSVVQPLTPLLFMGATHEALDLGVTSAQLQVDQAQRQAALNALSGYLGVLLAEALERSANTAVAELDSQLERLAALIAGGVALESDQLRLQVARAAAQQDAIVAASRVRLARAALSTAMGLGAAGDVTPVPLASLDCPAVTVHPAELYARAYADRPEFAALAAGARQAALGAEIKEMDLWPSLNAMLAYSHVEGQSLATKDSGFIGLALSWNAFAWGADSEAVHAARARARQVQEQFVALQDGVRLQVEQSVENLSAIVDGLKVAALAERQAEVALRLDSDRFAAGDATATDVVTAESALRQARDRHLAAQHQCLLAHANLRAAVGAPITAASILFTGAPE